MSSPPEPPPPRRPSPRTMPRVPARDFAQDEQIGRLLTVASIQLRRGQTAEAEAAVQEILQTRPTDAAALELLADIRLSRNDFDGAQAALQEALVTEPGRATAEAKLGRTALRRTEQQRIGSLGVAYAASDTALMRLAGGSRRSSQWATFASAMIPGLGQYVNGETVKGVVLAAVYFLAMAALTLLPDAQGLAHQISMLFVPSVHAGRAVSAPVGPAAWFLLFLLFGVWLYAVVDAALASRRAAVTPSPGRDGWRV